MKKPRPASPQEGTRPHAKGRRLANAAAPQLRTPPAKSPSSRASRAAERREAIVAAGLEEFVALGFAATRLDDVAKRAGVAKGTIYLHFKDKEALFEELIRTALVPLIGRLAAPPAGGGSGCAGLWAFWGTFSQEGVAARGGGIVRLVVGGGAGFSEQPR